MRGVGHLVQTSQFAQIVASSLGLWAAQLAYTWLTDVIFFRVVIHSDNWMYPVLIQYLDDASGKPVCFAMGAATVVQDRDANRGRACFGTDRAVQMKCVPSPDMTSSGLLFLKGLMLHIGIHNTGVRGVSQVTLTTAWFWANRLQTIFNDSNFHDWKLFMEQDTTQHIHIYSHKTGAWTSANGAVRRTLATVSISDAVKRAMFDDARHFIDQQDQYRERGIPFRRTYLLHGAPGCGKTSIIRAFAAEFSLGIYVLTIDSETTPDSFRAALAGLGRPCVLVIEDLDCVAANTASRTSSSLAVSCAAKEKMSLSELLNGFDGLTTGDGYFTVLTSNHVDHFDPALVRCGRVDVIIEIKRASRADCEFMHARFFPDANPKDAAAFADTVAEDTLSHADVQELLMQRSLSLSCK